MRSSGVARTSSAGEPLPIPDSLATLTAERFRLLPDDTRDAVLLAATAPVPTARDAGACRRRRAGARPRAGGPRGHPHARARPRPVRAPAPGAGCARVGGRGNPPRASSHAGAHGELRGRPGTPPRRGGDRARRGSCGGSRASRLEGTRPRRLARLRRALRARELADASTRSRRCARAPRSRGGVHRPRRSPLRGCDPRRERSSARRRVLRARRR